MTLRSLLSRYLRTTDVDELEPELARWIDARLEEQARRLREEFHPAESPLPVPEAVPVAKDGCKCDRCERRAVS